MRFVTSVIVSFLCISSVFGQVSVEVIYPKPGQELPEVDSTFIFGNVTKGARLTINGFDIPVHRDGGWLAFLPVEDLAFDFRISAILGDDTTSLTLPVLIGFPQGTSDRNRDIKRMVRIPNPLLPEGQIVHSVNSLFEFSFEATSGGLGWFRVGEGDSVRMYESESSGIGLMIGDPELGDDRSVSSSFTRYSIYTGYYRFKNSDIGRRCVYYRFQPKAEEDTADYAYRTDYFRTDSIITVIPEFPPVIGVLSGRSQIIRTGPRMGYKLLYQPAGIRVHITGEEAEFYKIDLAGGVTGYTNVDSVRIMPSGTPLPHGRISFIAVGDTEDGAIISADTGGKLPFEVRENPTYPGLEIDIYGVTGDVDWIRYNQRSDLIKLVSWSQPQDDVFRINVEFNDRGIGGYQPYYDGTEFNIRITKRPTSDPLFGSPVRGMKIAIDPGHSHDSGAVGPTGLPERDANLWIAHELRQMLLHRGAEVMMTRYGHENVALYDRPAKAEKWGADLLISIHNNALPDGINPFENNGTSVYYYHPHSKPLAEAIHKHLLKQTGLPDHGLYYGNLVLTRPTSVPAVLVECAFMMIPEQEALLKTDKFQRKCAKAILNGIEDYLRQ